jgi:hypothetical protein
MFQTIMNRIITISIALAMTVGILHANNLPKPDKKQRKADIQRLIDMRDHPVHNPMIALLQDGDQCFDYCMDAYYRSEEQYAKDTSAVRETYRQNDWIMSMCHTLTEKEVTKYHLEWFPMLMDKAEREMSITNNRFKEVTQFCDKIYAMRRQAAAQTMPTGKIKHLIYEEYGSSRPNPVYYEIKIDPSTGKVMLYGPENRHLDEAEKRPQTTLSEDVLNTIRQMVEEHKIYQEPSSFYRPILTGVPPVTGGPPSWHFTCELEDGKVSTSGEQMSPPRGCTTIANYLSTFLKNHE